MLPKMRTEMARGRRNWPAFVRPRSTSGSNAILAFRVLPVIGLALLTLSITEISELSDQTIFTRRNNLSKDDAMNMYAPKKYQGTVHIEEGNPGRTQISCRIIGIEASTNIDMAAPDGTVNQNISRFHASPLDSWTCQQEESSDYFLATIDFQIKECPPKYSASSFQLMASTSKSRIMGHVGDRYRFKDECGLYNASVAVMDYERGGTINLELFWVSEHRHYSNQLKDVIDAHRIKQESLPENEIKALFTDERLVYLQRHLDHLSHFPLRLQIQTSQPQPETNPISLPDCGTIPLQDWHPVGVFDGPINDTSHLADPTEPPRWPFRSARCQFHSRTLQQYNKLLAGLRIKFLGDSHMGELHYEAMGVMCPELSPVVNDSQYFERGYDCEFRNNSFNFAYRFFRMVFTDDFEHDFDAISSNLRIGSPKSCREILGLGLYNATIITIPHWIFVYETQEGLNNILISMQSLFDNCQESHGDLMKDHIFILQSATARDAMPEPIKEQDVDAAPWHSWRGIHNYRVEQFTYAMQDKLGQYIDGVIPFFEMSFARTVDIRTKDGIHLPKSSYRDMLHVQWTAVRSAMKFSRGLDLPIMRQDDPRARWFSGVELE